MSEFSLERVYGGHAVGGVGYKEDTGELFIGVGRVVKRVHIRNSVSSVLSLKAEDTISRISVDGDLLLVLDVSGRVYLYSLAYNMEIERMLSPGCKAAVVQNGKVYLEYTGYIQEWVVEHNGFFGFRKTKHVTGHRDTVTLMAPAQNGLLTSGYDSTLRFFDMETECSTHIRENKRAAISAKRFDNEVVAVWEHGEVSRHLLGEKWEVVLRKFTMTNLISADISQIGDMVVAVDTSHNVLLYSARTEDKEPLHKIFVSDTITHAQFVENDEWIVLSGEGAVIWEWRTNLLLFNEQAAGAQVCAGETSAATITGTDEGGIFIWDKGLSMCTKALTDHTSGIVGIVPTTRGFASMSKGGVWKTHRATGEPLKSVETGMSVLAFDADDDLLVAAGPRHLEMYDIKRTKKIAASEIGFPLAVKITGTSVMVMCMEVMFVVAPETTTTKDMAEPCTVAAIGTVRGEPRAVCVGESGIAHVYNSDLEEIEEFRVLPPYSNGIGKATPVSLTIGEDGSVVLVYLRVVPDKHTHMRTSMYAAVFQNGLETDTWLVLEKSDLSKDSGKAFISPTPHGTAVGVCTSSGVLLFTDRHEGFKSLDLWQKETPEEVASHIEKGNALMGAAGATRLQNIPLLRQSVEIGDALVLGKYFPIDLLPSLFPLLISLISDGMIEKPLAILKEALKRRAAPALLGRQLFLALNQSFEISTATTGYADALLSYPHLSAKSSAPEGTSAEKHTVSSAPESKSNPHTGQ